MNILPEFQNDDTLCVFAEFQSINEGQWDIVLIIEDQTIVNEVERILAILKINNEKDYIVSNGTPYGDGFFCNVIDILKVQNKIPEFVKLLRESGFFDIQFKVIDRAKKLQKITTIIKNG